MSCIIGEVKMSGLDKSLITDLVQAGAAAQVLEGEEPPSQQLSAVHYVFSLDSGDALGLQLLRVKVEHLVDGLELICVLSTVSSDLFAESFGGESLGYLEVETRRWEDRAHHSHAHLRGLELESGLRLTGETPLSQ